MRTKLEVCVDSLESAKNAITGGANELEVCSSLIEGGLTPSPGLVKEILKLNAVINIMIRCRGGSDFCYNNEEMTTMLSDIDFYKNMGVNRFVFGALTNTREIDKINCAKVLERANPIPVTFHRAFDVCKNPKDGICNIIDLGFDRLLTSGLKASAAHENALEFLITLNKEYGNDIVIMPGAGISPKNVHLFVSTGFKIVHSSCKIVKRNPLSELPMGSNEIYISERSIVEEIVSLLK